MDSIAITIYYFKKKGFLHMEFASLTPIITAIQNCLAWFFTLFTGFVNMIAGNSLLLWTVVVAIAFGVISLIFATVRRFGIRSR